MIELSKCPICQDWRRKVLYPASAGTEWPFLASRDPYSGHYQINKCLGCSLVFSSPVPNERDVRAFYHGYSETNVAVGELDNVRRTMEKYYHIAARYLSDKENVLDIGCDIGLLLEIARADGFSKLHGIEPVPSARIEALRRVPDANISEKFYEQIEFGYSQFDLITLIHVVDHLSHPDIVLGRAFDQLKPGGICLAVVHDVNSLLARLTGERFPVFNYLHHFFFSKQTLRALFEKCGFDVVRVASTSNVYSLSFFVERAPIFPGAIRHFIARTTRMLGLGRLPLSLPVGNIAIVAQKPETSIASR